jgi:hypothetical protein
MKEDHYETVFSKRWSGTTDGCFKKKYSENTGEYVCGDTKEQAIEQTNFS